MTEALDTPEITGVTGGDDFGTGQGTTSPGRALPFLFAWVDSDQLVYDESMLRNDEEILSIEIKHDEGQIPTLEIVIKNPRVGLLNANRKQWAWLAYQPPNLDPYAEGTFYPPGDYTHVRNGYGSSGANDRTITEVVGTPEWVDVGWVDPSWQVYDDATIVITPPAPQTPTTVASPNGSPASGPPPYINGNTVVPIFFGELVGAPDDLFAEKITLKFIARSMDYIAWKQACAETLKVAGNYDPVFLKEEERDDPDSILEGWSSLYHVDRTTLAVTASDVLVGEDGTVEFMESPPTAFYNSLKVKIGQAPLTNVQVQMQVHWTQRTLGYVDGPNVNVASYTGETFVSDFPKGGTGLGAGWTCEFSYINDPYMIAHTPNWNIRTDQQFYGDSTDYDCSVVSINESSNGPALLGPALSIDTQGNAVPTGVGGGSIPSIEVDSQTGACDPDSDPPTNRPLKLSMKLLYIPLWNLNCSWTLQYKAKREFTESAYIDILADTQAILTSPTVEQDTFTIKINGEVGQPVLIYDAWTDFAGQEVGVGQLIFNNNPLTPGGTAYQVCVTAGRVNSNPNDEPIFSDVPGTVVSDTAKVNPAQWASLGQEPQSKIQEMAYGTSYPCGTILVYVQQNFDSNQGTTVPTLNSNYYLVIDPNGLTTTSTPTEIIYSPPITESDELLFPQSNVVTFVEWLGSPGNQGTLTAPASGIIEGQTDPTFEGCIEIGNPSWLGIPVGGTTENVTARCYLPTARGAQSVQYAINRARAKMRMRSRAVEISWDCPIEMVLGMSCRMNAEIWDPRLPGGRAIGKVISYGMSAKGGKIRGHVTIGCSVGFNAFGNPNADIAYTAPIFVPFDDGLNFPLTTLPSDGGMFTNTLAQQGKALIPGVVAELTAMAILNPPQPVQVAQAGEGGVVSTTTGVGPAAVWTAAEDSAVLPELMQGNPVGWMCEIDSVVNGPFLGAYAIMTTTLEMPQGIDLAASSEND